MGMAPGLQNQFQATWVCSQCGVSSLPARMNHWLSMLGGRALCIQASWPSAGGVAGMPSWFPATAKSEPAARALSHTQGPCSIITDLPAM